jgi:hypothetical protein
MYSENQSNCIENIAFGRLTLNGSLNGINYLGDTMTEKKRGRRPKGQEWDPTIEELLHLDKQDPHEITEGYFFERCFIFLMFLRLKNAKEGLGDFAARIFPDRTERSSALRAIYAMKGTTKSGKPQALRIRHAYAIGEALGRTFPDFSSVVHRFMVDLPQYQSWLSTKDQ